MNSDIMQHFERVILGLLLFTNAVNFILKSYAKIKLLVFHLLQ